MNEVDCKIKSGPVMYKLGDIFKGRDGKIYILALVDLQYQYCLIGLCNGNRWNDPMPLDHVIREMTRENFVFVGRDLKIIVQE